MNLHIKRLGPLVGLSFLLAACTAARRTQVLTVIFDGVPARNPPAATPVAASPAEADEVSPQVPDLYLRARAAPPGVRHKPYANRECLSCHESQFSQKLRGEVAEICQLCHKSVFESRLFSHAPVEKGRCLECHKPHESMEPALLIQPERQVCAKCHEEKLVLSTPAHAKIGDDACHVCHESHGGQQQHLLKASPTDQTVTRPAPRQPQ